MKNMNQKSKIFLIIFVGFLVVVIAASSYAYLTNSQGVGDLLGANTTTAKQSAFSAYHDGDLAFNISASQMAQMAVSTNAVGTDTATFTAELTGTSDYETTLCSYDVVWVWDSADIYTTSDVELPYTGESGTTYPYELSVYIDGIMKEEMDLSEFDWSDDGKRATIVSNQIIASASNENKVIQNYTVTMNMYNIEVAQKNLFDKSFKAHIEVVSNGCTTNKLSENTVHAYAFDTSNNSYSELTYLPSGVDLYETTLNSAKTTCVKGGTYTEASGVPSGDECFAIYDVEYPEESLATVLSNKTTTSVMASNNAWGIVSENGIRYEGSDYVTPTGGNAASVITCVNWVSCTFQGDTTRATYTSYRAAAEAAVAQGVLEDSGMSNYICFDNNCTDGKYRIVGAFNETYDADGDGTTETTGYLTKIIRNELIEKDDGSVLQMAFEADNVGYWIGSDMETYLHGTYADGLSDVAKGYAVPVNYHLGNVTFNADVNTQYTEERGTSVHSGRLASAVATYGLIYPSDYGYAVLANDCVRTTNTGHTNDVIGTGYYVSACSQENWMYSTGMYGQANWWWNISPQASYATTVFLINRNGYVGYPGAYVADAGGAVRPSWYLRADTKIVDGSGTFDNPYILGL